MLHLEKVNGNNVWDILKLTVSESQKNFVATNEISIVYCNYGKRSCIPVWYI